MSTKHLHLFLALASAVTLALAVQVPVTIYYESLCPDSQAFFVNQFSKVYKHDGIMKYVQPEFVPWGHANVTADGNVSCQHKSGECDGNRLQACALKIIPSNAEAAPYIICIMGLGLPQNTTDFPTDKCKTEASKYYSDILNCYNNQSASLEYLKTFGQKTNSMFGEDKFGVPYVAVNNTRNDNVSRDATADFQKFICSNLKNENIKDCGNSASTFAATLIPAAVLLMLGRL